MYPLLRDCVFDCIGVLEQCNSSKLRQLARLHLLTEVRRRSFYGLRTIAKYEISTELEDENAFRLCTTFFGGITNSPFTFIVYSRNQHL
jgi:hypothetical protein